MFDRAFYRETLRWFASLARFRRYGLFLSSVATPAVVGVLGAIGSYSPDMKAQLVPVQVTVLIIAFLVGGGLFWFDEHPALIFQKLAHQMQRCSNLDAENSRQRQELVQLSAHINCLSVAARAVESTIVTVASRDRLEEIAKQLLDDLADQRSQLFGVEDDEQWNFAIYVHDAGQLRCLKHRRNFGGDAPRSWAVGSGHVGLAFHRDGELVTDDVASQEVFQGTGEQFRSYDKLRYRGVASICIPDVTDDHPIGILVATSSRVGRFSPVNVQPLRDLAQSLGAILTPRKQMNGSGDANG